MSPFYSLPRELRDEIYKFSFLQHDPSDESTRAHVKFKPRDGPSAAPSFKILKTSLGNNDTQAIKDFVLDTKNKVQRRSQVFPLPPICLASKTTYNEAVSLFLQSCTIYCSSPSTTQHLLDWLAKFPHPDGYGSIRSFEIQYEMAYYREYEAIVRSQQQYLFRRCTNLRRLTLVFRRRFHNLVNLELCRSTTTDPDGPRDEASKIASIVETYQFAEVVAMPMLEKLVLDFSSAFTSCTQDIPEKLSDWYAGRWREEGRAVVIECELVDLDRLRQEEEEEDGGCGFIIVD